VFTIPNFLTLLRFVMVPIFLILFFSPNTHLHLMATVVFLLASVTDWLDGFLARWLDQESELGKFADPLADKVLTVSLFFALLMRGDLATQVPVAVACIVLIAVMESGILTMSAVSLYRGVDLSFSQLGKLKTSIQFLTILLALFRLNVVEDLSISPLWLHTLVSWDGIRPWISGGFLLSALLTVLTFLLYAMKYPGHRAQLRSARQAAKVQARARRVKRKLAREERRGLAKKTSCPPSNTDNTDSQA
jgi:CDP-diacylglycerol--glycerol-3-phosphate 3-phosphatidyltransferase